MKKVKFSLGAGFAGCRHKETIEFEDDVMDEEIEADYQEWAQNYMDSGWVVIE